MAHREAEVLEHRLAKDIQKFRLSLIARYPEFGRSQVQEYVEEYAIRRRSELIGIEPRS